jgi:uncharacterized BrkB/YihY/UPF0761 family membrane protein
MIEALDIAYDANDDRPFWKKRLLAIALGTIIGALLLAAPAVMVVRFQLWGLAGESTCIVGRIPFSVAVISVAVLADEGLYFLAPTRTECDTDHPRKLPPADRGPCLPTSAY